MNTTRRRDGRSGLGVSVVTIFSAGVLAVFIVGILGTTLAFRGWTERLADRREMALTALAAAELRQTYTASNALLHDYLEDRSESDLARHTQLRTDGDAQLADLLERVAPGEAVAAELDAVAEALRDWEARTADPAAMAELPLDADVAAEQLDATLATLVTAQSARYSDATDAASAARRNTMTLLAGTFAVVASLCGLGIWAAHRWLTEPMRRLCDQVTEPGHGSPIVAGGPQELREIGAAVNAMRDDLLAERDKVTRARDALEQNAVLAAQVGAQLGAVLGTFPSGWSAAAVLRPATGVVAGDTYAVKLLGPHTIGVVLLDIVGHGAEPAIIALRCREVVLAGLRHGLDPGEALEGLKAHDHGLDHGNFLTAFLAVIDTDTGACRYANAGHPPALMVDTRTAGSTDGPTVTELRQTGPVFGPFPDRSWGTNRLTLPEGARLVVYSDGVTEARNGTEFYGIERLRACVAPDEHSAGEESAGEEPAGDGLAGDGLADAALTLAAIDRDLDLFAETNRRDDQSIVVVSRADPLPKVAAVPEASYASPA